MPDVLVNRLTPARGGRNLGNFITTITTGNDYYVENDGLTLMLITGGAAVQTVTFHAAITPDGQSVTPRTLSATAGVRFSVGPFTPEIYNVQSGPNAGRMRITVTGTDVGLTPLGLYTATP